VRHAGDDTAIALGSRSIRTLPFTLRPPVDPRVEREDLVAPLDSEDEISGGMLASGTARQTVARLLNAGASICVGVD
jgi:hypothetical protein